MAESLLTFELEAVAARALLSKKLAMVGTEVFFSQAQLAIEDYDE